MPSETNEERQIKAGNIFAVCGIVELPPGSAKTVCVSAVREIAVYNVAGEFFATENLCPHQGAPLAEGTLCGHTIECGLHGWQFDVRSGECLTVPDKIRTYEVVVDGDVVKILL